MTQAHPLEPVPTLPHHKRLLSHKAAKLLLGVFGIYASYLTYGVAQQKLFNIPYESDDGTSSDIFSFPLAIVIFPTFLASIAGYLMGFVSREGQTVPLRQQWLSGALYFALLYLTNKSLLYVSFPTQLIFRNCRLLAIVLVGIFFSRVKHDDLKLGKSKLMIGLVITAGVILFSSGNHRESGDKGNNPIGIALLILSMIVDGFLVDNQAYVKSKYRPTANMLFKCTSLYTFVISTGYSIASGQLSQIFDFLFTHKGACYDLLLVSIVGCTGQMSIYYLVAHFKQNVVPIVASTRKIFTLLLSLFIYNHRLSALQWLGIGVVFTGVGLEYMDERKQKIHSLHQKNPKAPQNMLSSKSESTSSASSSDDEEKKELAKTKGKKEGQSCGK